MDLNVYYIVSWLSDDWFLPILHLLMLPHPSICKFLYTQWDWNACWTGSLVKVRPLNQKQTKQTTASNVVQQRGCFGAGYAVCKTVHVSIFWCFAAAPAAQSVIFARLSVAQIDFKPLPFYCLWAWIDFNAHSHSPCLLIVGNNFCLCESCLHFSLVWWGHKERGCCISDNKSMHGRKISLHKMPFISRFGHRSCSLWSVDGLIVWCSGSNAHYISSLSEYFSFVLSMHVSLGNWGKFNRQR